MDLELSALVRIVTDVVTFDWFVPYKTNSSYQSVGTGFFIDMNGYILTCAHVVSNAIKVSVVIPAIGKDKFDAEIVAMCPYTDIALLKTTNYKNKAFLSLGNSDDIKPKDQVTAIGYPLGQDRLKYTSGIVSGIQGSLIQTDAPINSGNSGGPLVDNNNNVVGINSSKIASSKADNIGYAVPIYEFNILKKIMYSGKIKIIHKPKLYMKFNNVDKNILKYLGTRCKSGYLVRKIYTVSPLYKSGVRDGDIICSFDNNKIDNFGETTVPWSTQKVHMGELITRYKIGDKVPVVFWSKKNKDMIKSIIEFNNKDEFKIKKRYSQFETIDYEIINGCIIMELTNNHLQSPRIFQTSQEIYDNLVKYYATEKKAEPRLIITKIFGGSYMSKVNNINFGELLTNVNGKQVSTLNELRDIMKDIDDTVVFETELHNMFVNTKDNIIKEEKFLSKKHNYPLSKLFKHLTNKKIIKINKIQKHQNTPTVEIYQDDLIINVSDDNIGRDYFIYVIAAAVLIYILTTITPSRNM
jgi:S1-C subfamily serine protease